MTRIRCAVRRRSGSMIHISASAPPHSVPTWLPLSTLVLLGRASGLVAAGL